MYYKLYVILICLKNDVSTTALQSSWLVYFCHFSTSSLTNQSEVLYLVLGLLRCDALTCIYTLDAQYLGQMTS